MKTCDKHPKRKPHKKPHYRCITCLSIYVAISLVKPRALPMPTKVVKSKKTYSRKKKLDLDY